MPAPKTRDEGASLFTPAREETTILPHNNSESRVAGMYQMVGAGFSR